MARRPRRHSLHGHDESLPEGFLIGIRKSLAAESELLVDSLAAPSPTSIRLNPRKPFALEAEPVPWCEHGRYLAHRPAFTLDPLLHAGAYYVQEASSMLIEQAVRAAGAHQRDLLALDLCAAPGGKTTHLLSVLTQGSFLIANEIDGKRRSILAENCWKHGAWNVAVAGSLPSDLHALPDRFDLILLDAPCSGEGLFRRDPFARQQWSRRLVEQCARTQADILPHAWHALAPGGHLIYSTCTWESAENERQVARLISMGAEPVMLNIDPAWGVERTERDGGAGYRCYPHRVRGEGFFLALLRKPGSPIARRPTGLVRATGNLSWVKAERPLDLAEQHDLLIARPAAWANELDRIAAAMRITMPGIPVAERKGAEWVPHAAAALSELLQTGAVTHVELSLAEAMAYLRGETIAAADAHDTACAMYRGFGLGWLQGAGRRWNNRWPAAWRVRQTRSEAPPVSWSEY